MASLVHHFVRLIMSATVISVFLLFLLITASSSSVTEPLITIILKNFYYFPPVSSSCLYQGLSALRSQDNLLVLLLPSLLLQPNSFLVSHLITPQSVLVEAGKTGEDEGFEGCFVLILMINYLLTTIGMGRVRVNTPSMAQRPPKTLPRNV